MRCIVSIARCGRVLSCSHSFMRNLFAVLIIVLFGVVAALIIDHVAKTTSYGYYNGTDLSSQIQKTR